MQCPKCAGDMFDETKSKYWNNGKTKEGKQKPTWKCKDKANCDGVIWPPKDSPKPAANQPQQGRPATIARPLAPLYAQCLELAQKIALAKLPKVQYTSADIFAAAATIFIQACRDGSPLLPPPKAKPALVPAPPEPEDYPDDDVESSYDDRSLPF